MADKQRMKGITCCGDCVYYDWKKHKCSRGASVETDAREHFYDDCPIPDVEQLDEKEIRAKAIDEFAERMKYFIAKNVEDAEMSNDLCCEIYQSEVDEIAEQMRKEV